VDKYRADLNLPLVQVRARVHACVHVWSLGGGWDPLKWGDAPHPHTLDTPLTPPPPPMSVPCDAAARGAGTRRYGSGI
jgi:hypothetical protein